MRKVCAFAKVKTKEIFSFHPICLLMIFDISICHSQFSRTRIKLKSAQYKKSLHDLTEFSLLPNESFHFFPPTLLTCLRTLVLRTKKLLCMKDTSTNHSSSTGKKIIKTNLIDDTSNLYFRPRTAIYLGTFSFSLSEGTVYP